MPSACFKHSRATADNPGSGVAGPPESTRTNVCPAARIRVLRRVVPSWARATTRTLQRSRSARRCLGGLSLGVAELVVLERYADPRPVSGWEHDPTVIDDQALVVHLRGRGLVVLTGCSHAGAINILRHARRLTGVDEIVLSLYAKGLTTGEISAHNARDLRRLGEQGDGLPDHRQGDRGDERLGQPAPRRDLLGPVEA